MARVPRRAALLALLLLPGCSAGDRDRDRPAGAVTGTVAPTGETAGRTFLLRGTVDPAGADVRLLDGATGEQAAIARRSGAAFGFRLVHLPPGVNRFVVAARHPGRTAWRQPVRIVSRARRVPLPRRVTVTGRDRSPAEAILRLDRQRLVATAIGRDGGGMARIRVSADLRLGCRSRATGELLRTGLVRHDPPSQVEHAGAAPGARVATELRRRSDLLLPARVRCAARGARLESLTGVVWAEATNASGLDRYSAYVRLSR